MWDAWDVWSVHKSRKTIKQRLACSNAKFDGTSKALHTEIILKQQGRYETKYISNKGVQDAWDVWDAWGVQDDWSGWDVWVAWGVWDVWGVWTYLK